MSRDNDRSAVAPTTRRIKYWVWAPFLFLFVAMFAYGTNQRMKLREVQDVRQELALKLQRFSDLASEKKSLIEKSIVQSVERAERWRRAGSILYICRKLPEFPVDEGELFVYQANRTEDRVEVRFYAPEGEHEIELTCGIRRWRGRAGGGSSARHVGTQSRKTFRLPAQSTGVLRVELKNQGDECVVTAVLLGRDDQELDRTTYKYPKRVAFGRIAGSAAGDLLYLPGEITELSKNYRSNNFDMQKTSIGMNSLHVKFDFHSKIERNFICAERVGEFLQRNRFPTQLGRLFGRTKTLDVLRNAELRGDRLYFSQEEIDEILDPRRRRLSR